MQIKGVPVENMMERKQTTYQDSARKCVAFQQGQNPIYLTKIIRYCSSLKKQREVTLIKISTPQVLENIKKPAQTLVDNKLLIKVRAFRSEPRD